MNKDINENRIEIPTTLPDYPLEKRSEPQKNYLSRLYFIQKDQNDFFGGARKRNGLKLAIWTWASVVVDHLVITACTCFFMLAGTVVLQTSFNKLVTYKQFGISALYIYFVFSLAYFILLRIFLGATIGEYSCGLRLGQPRERLQKAYSFRILCRTVLITLTGVISMPILSMIMKKDLAGKICGVSVYSLK